MRVLIRELIAVLVLVVAHAAGGEEGQTPPCPAADLCPQIATQFAACSADRDLKACAAFVGSFRRLAMSYDCRRSFDTAPVPAVWLCTETSPKSMVLYEYIDLLMSLDSPDAAVFFAGPDFRGILDGHLAETYLAKSLEREKRLAQQKHQ